VGEVVMAQTVFFQIILKVDDTHCGQMVVKDTHLLAAIDYARTLYPNYVIIGARVAGPPESDMVLDEQEPFEVQHLFDVMVAVSKGFARIEYKVVHNLKVKTITAAIFRTQNPKIAVVGVRMVGSPVGQFTWKGKEL
jgi:phage gp29-like protein